MNDEQILQAFLWVDPSKKLEAEMHRHNGELCDVLKDHLARFDDGLPGWSSSVDDNYARYVYEIFQKRSGGSLETAEMLIDFYESWLVDSPKLLSICAEHCGIDRPKWSDVRDYAVQTAGRLLLDKITDNQAIRQEICNQGAEIVLGDSRLLAMPLEDGAICGWVAPCADIIGNALTVDLIMGRLRVGEPQPPVAKPARAKKTGAPTKKKTGSRKKVA